MRNLKKVLALVIAFCMMLSVVAFAGYNDVDADANYAGAVELLSALEIFQGDENGNFNPDNTITRAEMAAVICRAKGLEEAANASKGATAFADVAADHWASGYVNLASQNGIINGYGDGNFGPNDTVTYDQAVKMIVCALGFEPVALKKGGWPTGYLVVANTYKITEGAAANATRANLAILTANALDTPMMDQTSYGSDEKYEVLDGNDTDYRTLLTDMDIYIATGVVGDKTEDTVEFTIGKDGSEDGEFKKNTTETFEIGESNIAEYKYQQVDAYVLKDGRDYIVKAVIASNIGETFEILSDDIIWDADEVAVDTENGVDYLKGTVEYYVDAANSNKTKDIKIKLSSIEFNKTSLSITESNLEDCLDTADVELVFVENTGDTTYDVLIATQYTSDRVAYVDTDRDKLTLNVGTITFDFENEDKTVILVDDAGNALTLADFEEDDVVAYVADRKITSKDCEYIKIIKLANAAVTGTIDETYTSNGEDYIVVNGEDYIVAIEDDLQAGDEGTFYIGITGKVIDFDGSLIGENYAYLLEGAIASGSFTADLWELKLLTKEGIVTYSAKKDYNDDIQDYLEANTGAFDLDGDKFLFTEATDAEKANAARLVTFKVNSSNEIKELKKATGTAAPVDDEYNADAQTIDKKALEDDVVIFNIAGDEASDAYATDISFLIDESKYTGYVLKDADDEYSAMVITALESQFAEDTGLAVVTKVSTGKNEEGEAVAKITYVQNEEEGVITVDDDSDCKNASEIELAMGDLFMFNADANGLVSEYIVVATVNGGEYKVVEGLNITTDLGEDTEIVTGYIFNEKANRKSSGEVISYTADADTFTVKATTNKYTYNTAGRSDEIVVSDFMYDMDYAVAEVDGDGETTGKYEVYPVFARMVNGVVIDVITVTEVFVK